MSTQRIAVELNLLYLDGMIVYSPGLDSHVRLLEDVLQRFQVANLKLNLSKCKVFQREVQYLGHIVSEKGVSTDPDKAAAVREWARPIINL